MVMVFKLITNYLNLAQISGILLKWLESLNSQLNHRISNGQSVLYEDHSSPCEGRLYRIRSIVPLIWAKFR